MRAPFPDVCVVGVILSELLSGYSFASDEAVAPVHVLVVASVGCPRTSGGLGSASECDLESGGICCGGPVSGLWDVFGRRSHAESSMGAERVVRE